MIKNPKKNRRIKNKKIKTKIMNNVNKMNNKMTKRINNNKEIIRKER